jgi:hypothetical protein
VFITSFVDATRTVQLNFVAFFCLEGKVLAAASVDRDPIVAIVAGTWSVFDASTCSPRGTLVAELMHNNKMLSAQQLRAELHASKGISASFLTQRA